MNVLHTTLQNALEQIQGVHPLLHCISNIVTANDCANLALAIGASPIMAQEPQEMPQIAALAKAVVLNTGTPDEAKFQAAAIAGKTANQLHIPVILDPVGIGASTWRLNHIHDLLSQVHPDILRVNLGEAKALLGQTGTEHGVDSLESFRRTETDSCARELANALHTVVLLSGEEDLVTDGIRLKRISGGSPLTRSVTGAGCMLSVLCGAFASIETTFLEATPESASSQLDYYSSACLAAYFWKLCAETAAQTSSTPGSFRVGLFDAAYKLSIFNEKGI